MISRRTLLQTAAVAGSLTVVGCAPDPVVPKAAPTVTIKQALGVQIHADFSQTPYRNAEATFASVLGSGASYIRDMLVLHDPDQVARFQRYRDAGIKAHVTVGRFGETLDQNLARQRLIEVADCVDSVAGFNEPDSAGKRKVWLTSTVTHQKWLYRMVKADPALSHLGVLPSALKSRNPDLAADLDALYTAIDGFYDMPNLHVYPGPTRDPRAYLDSLLALVPGNRAWVTEGGGSTYDMDEDRQAFICTELLKAQAERGQRCYIYELLDQNSSTADPQKRFGIYRDDYTPKQAVVALQQMVLSNFSY